MWLSLACCVSCVVDPDEAADAIEYFEPFSSSGERRVSLLRVGRNVAAGPRRLGSIANDVARVEYSIGERRRPFLLEKDVREPVVDGRYLHLPQEAEGEIAHVETLADPTQWSSFRVYDVGICHLHFPWERFAPELVGGLAEGFATSTAVEGGSLVSGSVRPKLQAGPTAGSRDLETDLDRVHVELSLFAKQVRLGGNRGFFQVVADIADIRCDDVTFEVSLEVSVEPAERAVLSLAPITADQNIPEEFLDECPPSTPGRTLILPSDAPTRDLVGVVHEVQVEVRGCGVANGPVASAVANSLRRSLPETLRRQVLSILLLAPSRVGVNHLRRRCACDQQCNLFSADGPAFPGLRHRCVVRRTFPEVEGDCYVQLEPSRINIRPDGLDLVVIDTFDDPQAELLYTDWNDNGRPGGGVGNVLNGDFYGEWMCANPLGEGVVPCEAEGECAPLAESIGPVTVVPGSDE